MKWFHCHGRVFISLSRWKCQFQRVHCIAEMEMSFRHVSFDIVVFKYLKDLDSEKMKLSFLKLLVILIILLTLLWALIHSSFYDVDGKHISFVGGKVIFAGGFFFCFQVFVIVRLLRNNPLDKRSLFKVENYLSWIENHVTFNV